MTCARDPTLAGAWPMHVMFKYELSQHMLSSRGVYPGASMGTIGSSMYIYVYLCSSLSNIIQYCSTLYIPPFPEKEAPSHFEDMQNVTRVTITTLIHRHHNFVSLREVMQLPKTKTYDPKFLAGAMMRPGALKTCDIDHPS
jgi:hypothetical protein